MIVTIIWKGTTLDPSMSMEVFFVRHGESSIWNKNRIHLLSSLLVISLLKILDYGAVLENNACMRLHGDQTGPWYGSEAKVPTPEVRSREQQQISMPMHPTYQPLLRYEAETVWKIDLA
jgi:hypothetical protein